MSPFTPEEIAYLQSQRYGRLATVSQTGELHVVPVTFRYHPEYESIDICGENPTQTKKYRDAVRHGRVAFVVDDVLPPMYMRMIEIRGTVEGLPVGGKEMMASENRLWISLPHKRNMKMTTQPKAVHLWWIQTRLENLDPEEMAKRAREPQYREAMRSFQESLDHEMKRRGEAAQRTDSSR